MYLLNLIIIIPIIAMVFSDFKKRTINIIWLGIFALAILGYCLSTDAEYVDNIIANLIILGIITTSTTLYLIIRNKQLINPLKGYIGTGDLLFVVCLIPLWNTNIFLRFLIISFVSGIFWWLISKVIYGRNPTIPLVGIMGITFLLYHVCEIVRDAGLK